MPYEHIEDGSGEDVPAGSEDVHAGFSRGARGTRRLVGQLYLAMGLIMVIVGLYGAAGGRFHALAGLSARGRGRGREAAGDAPAAAAEAEGAPADLAEVAYAAAQRAAEKVVSEVGPATTSWSGPGSVGELEDRAAVYAARHAQAMMLSDTGRLYWAEVGDHQVVDDEGPLVNATSDAGGGGAERCQKLCDQTDACQSFTLCGTECYLKGKRLTGFEPKHVNGYCTSWYQTPDSYRPRNRELALPSDAPTQTFYVYRAQSPEGPHGEYPMSNVNVASLGGVMWYLHNELIYETRYRGVVGQRKYDVSRIRRFKITTKATTPLFKKGMNFGMKSSYDFGENTGPHRDNVNGPGTGWHSQPEWEEYGFYVGCNYLGDFPHQDPVFQVGRLYPDAIWYSLMGPCPAMNYQSASETCKRDLPGGLCPSPDGRGNCTYSIEEAGEIDIDELVGIRPRWASRADFVRRGGWEGSGWSNGGQLSFWNYIHSRDHNAWRVQAARDMFNTKYPDMTEDMPPPRCDYDYGRYGWKMHMPRR